MGRFLKGAAAGGVGAAVVMTATVALAGSGVGGIFNLGQGNTVGATTAPSGSTAGPQLQVGNGYTSTDAAATALKARRHAEQQSADRDQWDRAGHQPQRRPRGRLGGEPAGPRLAGRRGELLLDCHLRLEGYHEHHRPQSGAGHVRDRLPYLAHADDLATCNPRFAHLRLSKPGANPQLSSSALVSRLYPALADGSEFTLTTQPCRRRGCSRPQPTRCTPIHSTPGCSPVPPGSGSGTRPSPPCGSHSRAPGAVACRPPHARRVPAAGADLGDETGVARR